MVLLIDSNVLLDVLLKRNPFFIDSLQVLNLIFQGKARGILAAHTVTNVWYILRKDFDTESRRELILSLMEFFDVVALDKVKLIQGCYRHDFSDFEDCLQEECAYSAKVDYIVTRNKEDFSSSRVPVVSPKELVGLAM